jgi:hypothetical protein
LRILLSFNPDDVALAEAFRASLFVASSNVEVFFSPVLFEEYPTLDVNRADAFLLFVGQNGLAGRQTQELYAAVKRKRWNPEFIIVPILAAGTERPEIVPHIEGWIEMPIVTDRSVVERVVDALNLYGDLTDRSGSKRLEAGHDQAFGQSGSLRHRRHV